MKRAEFEKMGTPMTLSTPTTMIDGQQYKIGFCGIVFVRRNGDWLRTDNVTATDVRNYIELDKANKRKADAEPPKELSPYMIKKLKAERRAENGKNVKNTTAKQ